MVLATSGFSVSNNTIELSMKIKTTSLGLGHIFSIVGSDSAHLRHPTPWLREQPPTWNSLAWLVLTPP